MFFIRVGYCFTNGFAYFSASLVAAVYQDSYVF